MLEKLYISEATYNDVKGILEINHQFSESRDSEDGFLVIKYNEADIKDSITSHITTFYLVKESQENLLCYARVSKVFDEKLLDGMRWNREDSRHLLSSLLKSRYLHISQVAVKRGFHRQGIASFLYEYIGDFGLPILVFVALKPFRNFASYSFHESRGYTQIGTLQRSEFGPYKKYESLCYIRQI
ncbi:MAG: GNAT family N-acetyltransferase [Candidatus Thorarchaeota archaeon]